MLPPLSIDAYILARARAVVAPFAAGISESRNGISPCTTAFIPGKYIDPNAPEYWREAIRGATKLKTGLLKVPCGARICAARVGESAAGRPRSKPPAFRGSARPAPSV